MFDSENAETQRSNADEYFMGLALQQARIAFDAGEVPIGAVVVKDGVPVGFGCNSTESSGDFTCHAEMLALRQAAKALGGWRLPGCTLYVTLEPCAMCAGAIVLSRIDRLCIGTPDPKTGACGSLRNIVSDKRLNHCIEPETGILQADCEKILKDFFRQLRMRKGKNMHRRNAQNEENRKNFQSASAPASADSADRSGC